MARFLSGHALGITAAAGLLAGCAGDIPVTGAPAGAALVRHLPPKRGELQYVSNFNNNSTLLEFDYPKGDSPIGSITGYAGSECTSGVQTFWVVESHQVLEFKIGGKKPIATLGVTAGEPADCAVDATTGDVAVTILPNDDVVIFKPGSKSGTIRDSGLIENYFDGYDASGNLFVDGFSSRDAFRLVELPNGSSKFQRITTSKSVQFPGSVQWDGKYLTILDQLTNTIDQFAVSGTKAALKGSVSLSGASDCVQTWISRPYVYCADAGNNDVAVYNYPAGGAALATLTGTNAPAGVVSLRGR
jgi:hypothetical protein